ncbi:hypothetical protein ACIBQ3_00115 [Streptomyces rubiginosohelvolus]|uniref:hypothetical protein n=1 Tax=Streptomyces rubiginosohelvolus TaxID=67362 RepID=UPI0037B72353
MNTRTPNGFVVAQRGSAVLVLVAALLLLGILLGTAAHIPLPLTLAAAAVIGCWLLIFAVRERTSRRTH